MDTMREKPESVSASNSPLTKSALDTSGLV